MSIQYKESKRVMDLMQSEIRNMSIECDSCNGINLSQGICDLPLPDILKNSVQEAIERGYNHYTRYDGIQYLRSQIANKARNYNKIICDENENITVSSGATGALYCTCYALFDPGDEIILFEPFYGYHEYTLKSIGINPVYVGLEVGTWKINYELLVSKISTNTRAILICNPLNPCGKVFDKDELTELGRICKKYNLYLISDEIYEYITFGDKRHISPASLDILKDNTITISGYSKTYSITGWRIGYSIAPKELATAIGNANDLLFVCAPSPLQYAVAKAIEYLPNSFYETNRMEYLEKRDILCSALHECKLEPFIPEGAYYILADVSPLPGNTSKEKAMFLLKEVGVGSVPGDAFYHSNDGKNLVRFCFARDKKIIQNACELLINNKKW